MAPKQDHVYSRERSKSVAPSNQLIIISYDEHELEYVPPGTLTPIPATHSTTVTPSRVSPTVVTISESKEERILTGTPFVSATQYERASRS